MDSRTYATAALLVSLGASTAAMADPATGAPLPHWRDAPPLKSGTPVSREAGQVLAEPAARKLHESMAALAPNAGTSSDVCRCEGEGEGDLKPIRVQGCNHIDATHDLLVIACDCGLYGAPQAHAAIVDHAGKVSDIRPVADAWGDGGAGMETKAIFKDGRFTVSEDGHAPPSWRPEGMPGAQDCSEIDCTPGQDHAVVFRFSYELAAGPGGRFVQQKRVEHTLTGDYRDPATLEELRLDEYDDGEVRAGYRRNAQAPWMPVRLVKLDRQARQVVVRFASSATTYVLTVDAAGATLVSKGSDASKAQKFVGIPPEH
jgi:hypothetical protein